MTRGAPFMNVQLLVLQTVCQAQQLKVVNRLFLPRLRNMDRLSRPELVLHLKALGEDSPDAWTKLEIRQRIHELAEEQPSLAAAVAHKTPLETQMSLLNKNSKKKATLREYVEQTLGVEVSDVDTIAAMQRKASNKILQECEVHGADPMGFGKYSQLSFQETYLKDPDYCKWLQTTAAEGPCSIRLERFNRWLVKMATEGGPKASPVEPEIVAPRPKSRGTKSASMTAASSSSPPKTTTNDQRDEMILQMATVLQDLKEEVDQLRAERPRKVTSSADK